MQDRTGQCIILPPREVCLKGYIMFLGGPLLNSDAKADANSKSKSSSVSPSSASVVYHANPCWLTENFRITQDCSPCTSKLSKM